MTESDLSLPRGAVVPPAPFTADDFDREHGQAAKSDLFWQVSNRAYGVDCPTELQAWGNDVVDTRALRQRASALPRPAAA